MPERVRIKQTETKLLGLILAGGQNRRMKGVIKLFLPWHSDDILHRVREALGDVPDLALSVRDPEPYQQEGIPLIRDEGPEMGPLGGILAAFHQTDAEAVLAVTSDMPQVDREVIRRLLTAYEESRMTTLFRDEKYVHSFPGIYARSALEAMERRAAEGCFKVQAVTEDSPCRLLWVRGDELFLENVNTEEEYRSLQARTASKLPGSGSRS